MSLAKHVPNSQVDSNKEVQSIIEGDILTDPTKFAVMPDPAVLKAVGPDGGTIVITYSPELEKRRKAGRLTRNGVLVLKKAFTAQLIFKASDNNLSLQVWSKNKSAKGDVNTPAASRSFVKSYNVKGVETFEIFRGCVPVKTNYTIGKSGVVTYTIDLMCKTFERNQLANGGISNPTFASVDSAAPWITIDGGNGAFTYNGKKYGIESFSIDINRQWAMQDPSESLEILMVSESDYVPSGVLTVQKSDILLTDDALETTPRTMSLVLKAGTMIDTWTEVIFEGNSGINHDGTNPAGLTDSESYSSEDFVSA